MRILLAAAPHRDTFGYSMPPPGLLRLGGELERAGIDVELDDLAHALAAGELPAGDGLAQAASARLLARGDFDVIGVSVMGATLPIALAILERVRSRRRVTTWIGGPGTTGVDRLLIERFPCVDAVVRGEGEITVRELCAAALGGMTPEGVAGVTWRDESGAVRRETDREPIADLSALPDCAWHLLPPIEAYKRVTGAADGLVPVDSGRGCVYDCSFCTIGRFWSRRSRTLPARRLAEEVLHLRSMPGAKQAYLCHDIFGANRGQAIAFCDEMIARGSPVPFEVRARADHLDRELLERMARAGGYRVLIGVESADARVRDANQKGMRRGVDMLRVVDDCAATGITPILSLILGLPGEDEAALEASLDFCAQAALRAGVNVSLHLVNPQPGCGLGEEHGASSRPVEGIPPDMALGAGETAEERALIAAHPDLFTTFALLTGGGSGIARLRELHAIASGLPDVLMRYPRTFALVRERDGIGQHDAGQDEAGQERDDDASAGALATWRAWQADGRSFEAFARARRSDLVDDMLAWEQALVRAGARGRDAAAGEGVRSAAEIVAVRYDLPEIAVGLRRGERVARIPRTTWLAVMPARSAGTLAGVTTMRVTRDVVLVLETVRGAQATGVAGGTFTLDDLDAIRPGLGRALEELAQHGLVDLGNARRPRARTPTGATT